MNMRMPSAPATNESVRSRCSVDAGPCVRVPSVDMTGPFFAGVTRSHWMLRSTPRHGQKTTREDQDHIPVAVAVAVARCARVLRAPGVLGATVNLAAKRRDRA